jgi:hypothetical protein
MSDPLPNIAGDIPPGSGEETSSPPAPGRVLQMKPVETAPETLDERISEVINEVQNGNSGWQRLENEISTTWQEISAHAQALIQDLSLRARRLSQERPLYVIGMVTVTAFAVGAVLRATRSRYE